MNAIRVVDANDHFIESVFAFLGWLIIVLLIDGVRSWLKRLTKMRKEDGKHEDVQIAHLTGQLNTMIAQQRAMVDELRLIKESLSGASVEISEPYTGPTRPMIKR